MPTIRRAIAINAELKIISEAQIGGLEDAQKLVGGLIAFGTDLPNGDEVFVNDEGLLNEGPLNFFEVEGAHQPFAGNGYIIGAPDNEGDNTDAKSTIEEATKQIKFYSHKQIQERYK